MLEATFILTTDPILCRQKEFVRSLCLFQHGKIKGSTVKNGEWTSGETHPPSLQDVVANVNHRLTLLQPMGARGEDDEPTNGRSD